MSDMRACKDVFTSTLTELAVTDPRIVALTSDARGSVSLGGFAETCPAQFVEVGIAEQNEVGIAAGLASCGKKAFVCAPACFLSARSLEQIKVDVAYTGTNVKIIGVSGGVSYGALGTSHHSLHDIAVMRAIHGIRVFLPSDARQTRKLTQWLAANDGPAYVRMGRSPVADVYESDDPPFEPGKANLLRNGTDLTLIACGEMVRNALDAALLLEKDGISARVLDMHTLKPFDDEAVVQAASETGLIVTIEEHSVNGGLGAATAQVVVERGPVPMRILGIPDEDIVTGCSREIFAHYGLDAAGIARCAAEAFKTRKKRG
jgi:transketolase